MKQVRRDIIKYLNKRGRLSTTTGCTVTAPRRLFKNIPEEIINFLNIAKISLSSKEIAEYLGLNYKSVSKSLTKLFKSEVTYQYIKRIKSGKTTYFKCVLPHDIDISGLYKVIRNDKREAPSSKFTVERTPFKGKLLWEGCYLVSNITNEQGHFETVYTPLPIEVDVIDKIGG